MIAAARREVPGDLDDICFILGSIELKRLKRLGLGALCSNVVNVYRVIY